MTLDLPTRRSMAAGLTLTLLLLIIPTTVLGQEVQNTAEPEPMYGPSVYGPGDPYGLPTPGQAGPRPMGRDGRSPEQVDSPEQVEKTKSPLDTPLDTVIERYSNADGRTLGELVTFLKAAEPRMNFVIVQQKSGGPGNSDVKLPPLELQNVTVGSILEMLELFHLGVYVRDNMAVVYTVTPPATKAKSEDSSEEKQLVLIPLAGFVKAKQAEFLRARAEKIAKEENADMAAAMRRQYQDIPAEQAAESARATLVDSLVLMGVETPEWKINYNHGTGVLMFKGTAEQAKVVEQVAEIFRGYKSDTAPHLEAEIERLRSQVQDLQVQQKLLEAQLKIGAAKPEAGKPAGGEAATDTDAPAKFRDGSQNMLGSSPAPADGE